MTDTVSKRRKFDAFNSLFNLRVKNRNTASRRVAASVSVVG